MAGGWLAGAGAAELREPGLGVLSFQVAEAPMMEIPLLGVVAAEPRPEFLADFFFWAGDLGAPVSGFVSSGVEGAAVVLADLCGVSVICL